VGENVWGEDEERRGRKRMKREVTQEISREGGVEGFLFLDQKKWVAEGRRVLVTRLVPGALAGPPRTSLVFLSMSPPSAATNDAPAITASASSSSPFETERSKILAIQSACGANDVNTLKRFHAEDAPIYAYKDGDGGDPFHWAARAGSVNVLKYLLEVGPVDLAVSPDAKGRTPLMAACAVAAGAPAVEFLLTLEAVKATINQAQDDQGITALHLAVCHSAKIAKFLLIAGANPNAPSAAGPPLVWCLGHDGPQEAAMMLIESGAEIDGKDENGATPLILACLMGKAAMAKVLIDKGANVSVFARNLSPLAATAVSNSIACAELLLAVDKDLVHLRDPVENLRPVEVAAHAQNREICSYLASKTDATVNSEDLMKKISKEKAEEDAQNQTKAEASDKASVEAREEGNAFFRQGDYERASLAYTKGLSGLAANASPRNRAVLLANLSFSLFKQGKFQASKGTASQALALDDKYIKALLRLAGACEALKEHEESARAYWQAYQLDKSSKEAGHILKLFNEQIRIAKEKHNSEKVKE